MTRARWAWAAVAVVLVLAGYDLVVNGGPILGDPAHDVVVVNATPVTVLVQEDAGTDRAYDARLQPGESKTDQWLVPTTRAAKATQRRRVQAWDETGRRVFCREYTYDDLDRIGWRIEISMGTVECA